MSSRNHQARRTCGLAFAASLSLLICSVVPIAGYAQSFAISDVAFDEGGAPGNLTFTVTLDVALGGSATVDFSTADATATGGADYTPTSGTLTFLAGETTDTFTVGILADATDEVDEVFVVNLSNATGGASIAVSQAAATILDDDGPDIAITDATANEGGTAQFFVLLSAVSPQAVTVDYSTADATATTITGDYTTMFGTLTFSPGETAKIVDVATGADTVEEGDEAFTVDLTNAANATITDGSAVGTITDDDAVSIAIDDVTASESASTMTFTVSLSNPSAAAITVDYATLDGTATGGADYVAAAGTLTITAGATTETIDIPLTDDSVDEADEVFSIVLANVTGGAGAAPTLVDPTGVGTIVDNDAADGTPADYVRVVSRQGPSGSVVTIPVEIYDVAGLAVTAVDLDLLYDDLVLTPTSDVGGVIAVTTTGGVVPGAWSVIQHVPTPGQLSISLAGAFDAPLPTGGLLVHIDFDVAPTATADTTPPSAIQITAARLNEGAVSITGVDGTFTVLDLMYGDVTGDGTISAFDGSWVLEWVANDLVGSVVQFPIEISAPVWASLPLLPLAAQDVADVDDDGSTTAADATDILKKRVGLIDTFVAEGGAAAPSAEAPVIAYGLRGSATSQRPGARITVSLDTSDIDGLTAGEVVLDFDASLLRLVNTTLHAGGVKRPLKVQTERDGRVAIAFASARPLTPSDALLEVTFEARGVVSNPVESSIRATHLRLNRSLINTGYSYPFRIEPYRFALMPNYPNPFNPETWIPFELSQDGDVTVRIYGLDGDVVRTLDLGYQPMGEYRARHSAAYWDGRNDIGERVASGLYVYELTAGDRRAVRRMVISK